MKISVILFLSLAACNRVQATSATTDPIGRFQVSVLGPSDAFVIDSVTGCLDRVRIFNDHEVVTPVTGYQSQDGLRAALGGDSKGNQRSCSMADRTTSEPKK